MDFERIDINQCPPGQGNNGPNIFSDTARCKKETTEVRFFDLKVNFFWLHEFVLFCDGNTSEKQTFQQQTGHTGP